MSQYYKPLSLQSVEPISISFRDDLPDGLTVASAQAWLILPDGTTASQSNVAVATPTVTVTVGPFTQLGDCELRVLASLSGGNPSNKLAGRVTFTVAWDDDG